MSQKEDDVSLQPFLYAFLTFLSYIGKHSLRNCQKEDEICEEIASVLNKSITLLWQIHITRDILQMSFSEVNFEKRTSLTNNAKQAKKIIIELENLKQVITKLPCLPIKNKQACLLKIEQIKAYYFPNSFVKIEDKEISEPWIASSLKQNKQK